MQVLPTELAKDDKKHLKVEMIQIKGVKGFKPTYIMDMDSEITITPAGIDTAGSPGLKVFQRHTKWDGKDAVLTLLASLVALLVLDLLMLPRHGKDAVHMLTEHTEKPSLFAWLAQILTHLRGSWLSDKY